MGDVATPAAAQRVIAQEVHMRISPPIFHCPPTHAVNEMCSVEWVYLIPEYFGKQRVDGWVCYPSHNAGACTAGHGHTAAGAIDTKLEQMRIEAEVLCPYKQL